MIKHCVFCSFRTGVSETQRLEAVQSFEALVGQITGLISIKAGPNKDFERKSDKFSHGFIASFTNEAALQDYANHPAHQQLGKELVALCAGGADGIVVFDLVVDAN
ncbi:Dabb family protein [Maritalea porphyrae]|uniref:Dabb family protein n=1 Tax=Maritalea porphyrae TaxID=880732 RepID=UPI0022AF86F7|nr:Dabb family protein [Maritalea porphyrae]MCZ4270863.1 Dabb family protein [Maritalea porphyrae]